MFERLFEDNGIVYQTMILAEECGELVKEASKCARKEDVFEPDRQKLIEEMADVSIMINELCFYYEIEVEELYEMIDLKMDRLRERFQKGEAK